MTSGDLFTSFFRRIKDVDYTLRNVGKARAYGKLVERDLALAYEGLFLQSVIAFELLIEDVFLSLLAGKATHPRPARPRVVFPSIAVARRIVTRSRYEDWLPYSKLKQVSELYFVENQNPFVGCPEPHPTEIQKACHIRNYIAHKSAHARDVFERNVVAPTSLPAGRRNLLGYLLLRHSSSANKFEYHIGELVKAARWFCT